MGFFTAPRVTWGPGAIEQLSALAAQRAFIVADPQIAPRPRTQQIVEELQKTGATIQLSTEVRVEPTLADVDPIAQKLRTFRPDWILAVGGGSTIDTAKGAWIRYANPDLPLESVTPLLDLGLRNKAHFVAIPSTSGSGSEASWQAHFSDPSGRVVEVASRELIPDWAVLDPALPASMPADVAANTAADFFAHALEALASEWANPFSDAFAKEALATAFELFPKLARPGADEELRIRLLSAATMAGLAVSNAQAGNAHALAHALRPVVPFPHGRLVGIVLPYVVDFNFPSARDRYATLSSIVGPSTLQNREGLATRVRSLLRTLGIPESLEAAGADAVRVEAEVEAIVGRAMMSSTARANPRVASPAEWRELIRRALHGTPTLG